MHQKLFYLLVLIGFILFSVVSLVDWLFISSFNADIQFVSIHEVMTWYHFTIDAAVLSLLSHKD